jgi:hypothetical protein
MLRDSVVDFLRDEYRHGYLLVNPDQFCTVAFLEHLATFIERQGVARGLHADAIVADLTRQVRNLERWIRWLLPHRGRRGGRP